MTANKFILYRPGYTDNEDRLTNFVIGLEKIKEVSRGRVA